MEPLSIHNRKFPNAPRCTRGCGRGTLNRGRVCSACLDKDRVEVDLKAAAKRLLELGMSGGNGTKLR